MGGVKEMGKESPWGRVFSSFFFWAPLVLYGSQQAKRKNLIILYHFYVQLMKVRRRKSWPALNKENSDTSTGL